MQNKKPLIALALLLAAGLLIFFLLKGNKAKAGQPPADGNGVQPPVVTPRFTPEEKAAILNKGKSVTDALGSGKVVKTGSNYVLQKTDGSQVQITEEEGKAVSFMNKTNKITGKK